MRILNDKPVQRAFPCLKLQAAMRSLDVNADIP